MLFIWARKSTAGHSYGKTIAVRDKLNTDPNLTPNPIRTHDRAPNPGCHEIPHRAHRAEI